MRLRQDETWKLETEPRQYIQVSRLRHEKPSQDKICVLRINHWWLFLHALVFLSCGVLDHLRTICCENFPPKCFYNYHTLPRLLNSEWWVYAVGCFCRFDVASLLFSCSSSCSRLITQNLCLVWWTFLCVMNFIRRQVDLICSLSKLYNCKKVKNSGWTEHFVLFCSVINCLC